MGVCLNIIMTNKNQIIEQTQKWLSSVIIKHSICPFAKREYDNSSIDYEILDSEDLQTQLEHLILQCEKMDNDTSRETCLLVFPKALSDFEDYLDALDIATELMIKQGYEGIYQLASFHPDYCFADADKDDASNYTNRSPYPMFHILREASIEKALANFPDPETIPERNIALTNEFGLEKMKKLLANCY
ncbi:MAG: hypothetical protein ACI88H_000253 [Cocleimonas sp.]|jgi:hypothetical protein